MVGSVDRVTTLSYHYSGITVATATFVGAFTNAFADAPCWEGATLPTTKGTFTLYRASPSGTPTMYLLKVPPILLGVAGRGGGEMMWITFDPNNRQ